MYQLIRVLTLYVPINTRVRTVCTSYFIPGVTKIIDG